MQDISRKAILFIILDQDKTFREYIQPNWPDLLTLGSFSQFRTIAYRWDQKIPEELHKHFDLKWMRQNILQDHGPLCARYEAHPQKGFRSEGDSPAFMHQIRVGLRSRSIQDLAVGADDSSVKSPTAPYGKEQETLVM